MGVWPDGQAGSGNGGGLTGAGAVVVAQPAKASVAAAMIALMAPT
jgi:hypothetical protein